MDERQRVCYSRSATCSLRGSVCCVIANNFFPLVNLLFNSPNHGQNMTCCSPLKLINKAQKNYDAK